MTDYPSKFKIPDCLENRALIFTHLILVLQICSVKPLPDTNNPVLKAQAPEKIQAYYNVNNVDAFLFDRRLNKVREDPENEFKNMWIERTVMRTANPLPGILRWFEVIEKKVEEIIPVRYACERIEDVNRQLRVLVNQYVVDPTGRNVNPLSMRLQVSKDFRNL